MGWKKQNIRRVIVGMDEFMSNSGFATKRIVKRKENKFLLLVKFFVSSATVGVCFTVMLLVLGLVGFIFSSPFVQALNSNNVDLDKVSISSNIDIVDSKGQVFATIYSQERQKLTSIDQVGDINVKALVDTEDKRFFEHKGFDPVSTSRAFITKTGGGSGITQQLVKNLLFYDTNSSDLSKQKAIQYSIARKAKELKLALDYEKTHSKNEILLNYFNTVAFGGPNIYGIQAAAKYFFNKNAKDLSLAESSALIGTVNNPNIFFLSNEPDSRWKERQKIVLDSMLENKTITKQEYDEAYSSGLVFQSNKTLSGCAASKYPFYCDSVVKELLSSDKYGVDSQVREAFLKKGGFRVETFLDPSVQDVADTVLKNGFGNNSRVVAPTVVVSPNDSSIKALSVNREYGAGEGETTINPVENPSGTGSVFKMFTLATALEDGVREKDLSFAGGCNISFPGYDAPPGGFKNSTSCALQGGVLNYEQATAYSSNTWFVRLLKNVGVDKVKRFVHSVGLSTPEQIGDKSLSYTLGVSEENPIRTAGAFATFVNDGIYCPPSTISRVVDKQTNKTIVINEEYDRDKYSCRRVMKPENASVVLKAMHANVSGSIRNAFGVDAKLNVDSVGKSGTNQLYNSTWVQATGDNVLFTNVYDFDLLSRGIETVPFYGKAVSWHNNVAKKAGHRIMSDLYVNKQVAGRLNFSTNPRKGITPKVNEEGFIRTPNVVGIKASNAVSILEKTGYKVRIAHIEDHSMPDGVVVSQSIEPERKVLVSKKHKIVLNINRL